ncbi:TPA_asm: hypothetical protein [Porphyromonas phage phage017a_JCVISC001]|uniref:Uncharacterized protein n=1 Tax=Porphyromonas phage phage017a_JCVISC001 TaxID=3154107 RepID=A0AAT9JBQ3_9CAUD
MRTTNSFFFMSSSDKSAKDFFRTCLEEMLATLPDDSLNVELHLNIEVCSRVNAKGETVLDICSDVDDSTISFAAPLTKTEGGQL